MRLILVFWGTPVLLKFRTVSRKMSLLVTVVTDGLTYVLLISVIARLVGSVSRIDIGSREAGVPPYPCLAVVPLFFPSSLLVDGFAGGQGV